MTTCLQIPCVAACDWASGWISYTSGPCTQHVGMCSLDILLGLGTRLLPLYIHTQLLSPSRANTTLPAPERHGLAGLSLQTATFWVAIASAYKKCDGHNCNIISCNMTARIIILHWTYGTAHLAMRLCAQSSPFGKRSFCVCICDALIMLSSIIHSNPGPFNQIVFLMPLTVPVYIYFLPSTDLHRSPPMCK